MSGILLDTNVVSEMRKPPARRSDEFNQWAQGLIESEAYLSVVTITEIEKGILLLENKDQQQAAVLRRWFIERVLTIYKKRILPVSLTSARLAAGLGLIQPISMPDAYLAATALEHKLVLATRNTSDFTGTGVTLVNPWE